LDREVKIIFTVSNDLSYDQRMQRICTSLVNAGYEVCLVGRKKRSSVELQAQHFKQTRLNCIFEKGKLFYLEYNIRLLLFLLFNHADIYSAVDLDTLLPCLLAAKIKSKKLVFDAHEYFTEVPEVVERPLTKKIWEFLAGLCIPHANKAYTVGTKLSEIFTEKYKTNFEIILNVPSSTHQQISTSINQHIYKSAHLQIILYQGALNEGRGLEECILAMHRINAELQLAGEGDLSTKLRTLVAKEGLTDKVKFLGFVKPNELKQITSQAYIGLNLLRDKGLSYYYSLANKFFDYIHAGVPCICADFPEYQNINMQYDCTLLCPADADRISDTINILLNDKILYQKLKDNCLKAKEDLCWEKEEIKLLNMYKTLS